MQDITKETIDIIIKASDYPKEEDYRYVEENQNALKKIFYKPPK